MARLEEKAYTYFTTVRGMCRACRRVAPARVFFHEGQVWQQSLCKCLDEVDSESNADGKESRMRAPALIASDQNWYLDNVLRPFPDRSPLPCSSSPDGPSTDDAPTRSREGCPRDCGPCSWHASPCQLPVVSITNACNLNCPICFTYNRKDRLYFMPVEEMQRTVDWIVESSESVDLINITGGEPTLHPDIIKILECCNRPEIGRVTMNSNGLRLAEDGDLCSRLAEMGVYVILSCSTFDSATSERLHGRDVVALKQKAIENLTAAGVKMTLLNVMVRGENEEAVGDILDLMRKNDQILSLTVQTMTYTGQGGGRFNGRRHIPVDEAARIVSAHSRGAIDFADFTARPSAHPLCYLTCYMLKSSDSFVPFTRFASKAAIEERMRDSYLIRLEKDDVFFRDIINELYAKGDTEHLKMFRRLIEQLFPPGAAADVFERQRIAESAVRTIYVHTHMDEDTFDCARAMMCPDLVPAEPGQLIPACTYNLFYRMQDDRFYAER